MDMKDWKTKLLPKSLRAQLLNPIIFLVIAVSVGIGAIEEIASRTQLKALVDRQGVVALQGINKRLQDTQRDNEIFAQLLAEQSGIAKLVGQNQNVGLAQIFVPLKTRLSIDCIEIFNKESQELLDLGISDGVSHDALISNALSGLTKSDVVVSREGLIVSASAPIKSSQGIVGAIVVSTRLQGETLKSLQDNDTVEFAVFQDSQLISTTTSNLELVSLLKKFNHSSNALNQLNQTLERFNLNATIRPIENGGSILALISTRELVLAAKQRETIKLIGTLGMVLGILLVGILLTRKIAKPLEIMVDATRHIMYGNYNLQMPPSFETRELNDLAKALNYLAQQLQDRISKLTYQAFHDPLTNLPNRKLFEDRLQHALVSANRSNDSIAVLFLDLDNFKLINDSFGHKAGDQLLIAVSKRLETCLRNSDTLARLGGDEFTILLENILSMEYATAIANRIAEQLEAPFSLEGHEIFVTTSIGIATGALAQDRPENFLRNADAAMYEVKKSGKAHHQVFNLNMASQARQQLLLESELRRAIEHEEFKVYYQPIVQLDTGKIVEVEALVRWQHPQRGLVPPLEFISLAEETGLIIPIGQWVLQTACRQLQEWHLQYSSDPPLIMSINLSSKQFQQTQIAEKIAMTLQEHNLEPWCIKIEITESLLLKNTASNIDIMQRLKDLGVHLAIDDFGTGFSALNYLKQFPIDTLKIDRAFTSGLGEDVEDTAIVHAIIAFAKALNLSITAEGIETADQLALLQELKCDRGQGYYFSKPLTSEALSQQLALSRGNRPPTRSLKLSD
jgi:diguanylate cyclase (GGDEF)-like protein